MTLIQQTRIRSLARHLGFLAPGTRVIVAVRLAEHRTKLEEVGFPADSDEGDSVLPAPDFGPISLFNAEGGEEVHRDQPMETAYRFQEWSWTEWHGRDPVEQTDFRSVPYQRYPRTPIPPPGVELTKSGDWLVSPSYSYGDDNPDLLHVVNLFLEIFGEAEVLEAEGQRPVERPRRLHWEILPRGRFPWARLQERLETVLRDQPNRPAHLYRLQVVASYEPNFTAVGRAGFRGYFVFGFEEEGIYVLESAYPGNATYVLGRDWEEISKLTKAEILSEQLHDDRIIHDRRWARGIANLLGQRQRRSR